MTDRAARIPGPDHPITIERNPKRVIVSAGDTVLAETDQALTLREASYPPVHYIPLSAVRMDQLTRSDHSTYCPYKGDASYYSLPALGVRGDNAVWTYEHPHDAVSVIASHLAFYPDRVTIREEEVADAAG